MTDDYYERLLNAKREGYDVQRFVHGLGWYSLYEDDRLCDYASKPDHDFRILSRQRGELEICPLCGSSCSIIPCTNGVRAQCDLCALSLWDQSPEGATAKWNVRPELKPTELKWSCSS